MMETETRKRDRILELAWQQHANLDLSADKHSQGFYKIRKWIAWLGILATLFAILTQQLAPDPRPSSLEAWVLKVYFIAIPIVASIFAAFATKFYSNGSWLIYRAGAEEVKKEIYIYRTILPKNRSRRDYLERRLGEIQRKVFRNLGGEYALEEYKGPVPSSYYKKKQQKRTLLNLFKRSQPESDPNKNKPSGDPGFDDLDGDGYIQYRLKNQLDWHHNKIIQRKKEGRDLTIALLCVGGAGAFLAALGGFLAIWVAVTASVTSALLGWQELKKVDEIIKNYSKVVLELGILYNHWQNLTVRERTPQEFEKMVLGCERVLWTQNREFIRSMQEALREADLEKDAALINEVIQESKDSAQRAKENVFGNIKKTTEEALVDSEQIIDAKSEEVLGTLTEEFQSEIVQEELKAMAKTVAETAERGLEHVRSFADSLAQVAQDYAQVNIGKDTDKEELNAILASYPKTGDVKG